MFRVTVSLMQTFEQQLLNVRPRPHARLLDFDGSNYAGLRSAAGQLLAGELNSLYIHAQEGSGRSHFLSALCKEAELSGQTTILLPLKSLLAHSPDILEGLESNAFILCDDVDAIAGYRLWEEALFHLYNRSRAHQGRWVFAARTTPAQAGFTLPDLVSRLQQASCWHLSLPDDDSRRVLLATAAERRGMGLDDATLDWILRRAPRQPAALLAWLDEADKRSLSAGRRLTVPLLIRLFDDVKSGN